ncbi:divalent-cation tolerance protein CutA [Microvirga sp. W0021]|uniref:Divalent-cation tolerance protein CutA n=1 Tax=Hohaiivirga grylli TaxID=3133970 RepID=A0ABV0BMM7_9HYPH
MGAQNTSEHKMIVVYSTFPDADSVMQIARIAVQKKLAACVNIIPQMTSVYEWQGAIETGSEVVALFKTRQGCLEPLGKLIKEHHPYDTPVIFSITTDWVEAATHKWLLGGTT